MMTGIDPLFVLLVLIVSTLDRALMTFKWLRLLGARGVRLPFLQGMKIYCASMVWGLFLPSTVGADAIRAFSASRAGLDSNQVVSSIIIERMVGFLSALLLGLLSLTLLYLLGVLDSGFVFVWWGAVAVMVGGIIVFAASFSQNAFDLLHGRILHRFQGNRIARRLREFHSTYRTYQDNKRNLSSFFVLTFGEQLLTILNSWLVAQGLGIEVDLLFVAGAVPLAILVSRVPVSVNGLGVYDGVFMLLMSLHGVSPAEALAIVLASRVLQVISWLPWWLAHVIGARSIRRPLPAVGQS